MRTTCRSPAASARKVSPDQPPASGVNEAKSIAADDDTHGSTLRGVEPEPSHPPVRVERRASRRGGVPAGQRSRLGPLRRRVPGHPRRVPGRRRLRLGTRGPDRGRGGGARRAWPAGTCSRSAPAPASARAGCAPRAGAPSVSTSPTASCSTRAASTTRPAWWCRRCWARRPTLPFARRLPSTWCSAPSARCSSSATSTIAVAETARVLRPGGRFAFSITHPTRWMFPDDPGEEGLVASQSYWDRTPYVEIDDATGVVAYVEHHRTLGDWVALLAGRGLPHHRPARAGVAGGPTTGCGAAGPGCAASTPRARRSSPPTLTTQPTLSVPWTALVYVWRGDARRRPSRAPAPRDRGRARIAVAMAVMNVATYGYQIVAARAARAPGLRRVRRADGPAAGGQRDVRWPAGHRRPPDLGRARARGRRSSGSCCG